MNVEVWLRAGGRRRRGSDPLLRLGRQQRRVRGHTCLDFRSRRGRTRVEAFSSCDARVVAARQQLAVASRRPSVTWCANPANAGPTARGTSEMVFTRITQLSYASARAAVVSMACERRRWRAAGSSLLTFYDITCLAPLAKKKLLALKGLLSVLRPKFCPTQRPGKVPGTHARLLTF